MRKEKRRNADLIGGRMEMEMDGDTQERKRQRDEDSQERVAMIAYAVKKREKYVRSEEIH